MDEHTLSLLSAIQAKYADTLLVKAHVLAVGLGYAQVAGEYTEIPALVVMVDEKLPLEDLDAADRLPQTLEGVRVDVVAVGTFSAFSAN